MMFRKEDGGLALKVSNGFLETSALLRKPVDVTQRSNVYIERYWKPIDEDVQTVAAVLREHMMLAGVTKEAYSQILGVTPITIAEQWKLFDSVVENTPEKDTSGMNADEEKANAIMWAGVKNYSSSVAFLKYLLRKDVDGLCALSDVDIFKAVQKEFPSVEGDADIVVDKYRAKFYKKNICVGFKRSTKEVDKI